MDEELKAHYGQLLGLASPWSVKDVELDLGAKRITIEVEYSARHPAVCPIDGCAGACPIKDHRPVRRWRHLDTMQFETEVRCRIPRSECPSHGVKSIAVPWAAPRSQFTLLFERFAIEVLLGARSIRKAQEILGISWDQAQRIQEMAVERGLMQRTLEEVEHVGMDEKSFGRGQSYISIMTDIDQARVLDVTEGRDQPAAKRLWSALPVEQRGRIRGVAIDMWEPYMAAARESAPQAGIVHDKFHVAKYLSKAVDNVRRKEHQKLKGQGSEVLTGTRYVWLTSPENWSEAQQETFAELKWEGLKVGRAWAIKEAFGRFWIYRYGAAARSFFKRWYYWATHSQLQPIIDTAKTLRRHLSGLLSYLRHRITNAVTEGLNSKIQTLKSNARGFRNFEHYRVSILFHCGKLRLYP